MTQKNDYNRLLEKLEGNLSILPDKKEETPENTLAALWLTSAGGSYSPIRAVQEQLPVLTSAQLLHLEDLVQERLLGVPLAHLTERQHYLGLDFIVKKGLYIPRRETELLAQTAISLISENYSTLQHINVIDLCSGIGTVALAIAHYCQNAKVFGSDIYKPAVDCAQINARHFNLESRSSFIVGDLFDPTEFDALKGKTQIIVSAPPYISTAKVKNMASEISNHEPSEAFDAGAMGLSIFLRFISKSHEYLESGGFLAFECGLGQGELLIKLISGNKNYSDVKAVHDEAGNIRVVVAKNS